MELNITGDPHVRFDEQGVEPDLREPDLTPRESKRIKYTPDPKGTAPPLDSTVIRGLVGSLRYQRADERCLRKALEARRRPCGRVNVPEHRKSLGSTDFRDPRPQDMVS